MAETRTDDLRDLRANLKKEAERWLVDAGPDFQWTTEDVIDFAQIMFERLVSHG